LTAYHGEALSRRYCALVERVAAAEAERTPERSGLAEAAAVSYAKLTNDILRRERP
jgi:hypothetical protein